MPELETADSGTQIDMESAVDRLGAELFPEAETPDLDEPNERPGIAASEPTLPELTDTTAPSVTPTPPDVPVIKAAPKSWPQDMHNHWGKMPKEAQDYWEKREKQMLDGLEQYKGEAHFSKQFKESLAPYRQTLQQLGVDELTAAKSLFQADHLLRYSAPDQKRAYFEQLAKNYGIDLSQPVTPPQPVDPMVNQLQQKFSAIEQQLAARQQADLDAARRTATSKLDAFIADPAHSLFDDCADDIARFFAQGLSLQDAYDKAVWANPVTREKQVQSRLQTEAEKAKERARLDALPKKKAAGVNVRQREMQRSPTEPLGSMEDTMRETLAKLKAR